ncbi:MAG TPA: SAM-dependent methyltransferase [Methylophilaceae bacterium]|nr:SAM-dependent methyltransferase [Methylophilaceae bacterium]
MAGIVYFIPVTLGDDNIHKVIPQDVIKIIHSLDSFIVENEKTARQFLAAIQHPKPIREIKFDTLNEHTADNALPALLASVVTGHDVGLMSEAGCPGIADPGAKLAMVAHQKAIRVAPLVGPSAILLGLMASGLNGQHFTFLGYLPSDKTSRIQALKRIEKDSKIQHETQIFIETPYRNTHMLEDILASCNLTTQLCIACNISLPDEYIMTKSIQTWKQTTLPDLHKKPTVFLLLS